MPLSPSATREPIHHRKIDCTGYLRADGLWDIEGHLVDSKSYDFENSWRGQVHSGTPVHDMWLRLTIDERFIVREVEAATEASPYAECPEIVPNFKKLIGLCIGRGWNRKARELLGGISGCTHLVELLGPLATTAFQSIRSYQRKRQQELEEAPPRNDRRFIINTCHAWSDKGQVVKRWAPEFYLGGD
jgi:hypothetical protein